MENTFIYFYKINASIDNDFIIDAEDYSILLAYDRKTGEDLCKFLLLKNKINLLMLKSRDTRPIFIDPEPRITLDLFNKDFSDSFYQKIPSTLRVTPVEKSSRHVVDFAGLWHKLKGISLQELYDEIINNVKEVDCYD